ncbi:DEAD/DEAH box helicase [Priestia megaterium]|uniref:DEAD/DEAH box helicase n=1 Tax=Priestia megaterium TaxID=1404 RepID=UPI0020405373|nr:DEAD/DEAH box helicase [Priestia megaterium]MCM3195816.1 DEAD/DEAH box helicase [Priestia megaterium]
MDDVFKIFNNMRQTFINYMDSPFALGNQKLSSERNALLEREGNIYQYPYIEFMPPYKSSERKVIEACESIKWSEDFADFADIGLFDKRFELHSHQYKSLQKVLKDRKNVVVTSGTGSGKTESFLLPLIASILEESKNWNSPNQAKSSWWEHSETWHPKRENETRKAAIRGLILYPLNALVEDQLVRLRQALDSDEARDWLQQNRNGNSLYFGRYTGKTPVSGNNENKNKVEELKGILKDLSKKEVDIRKKINHLINNISTNPTTEIKKQLKAELRGAISEEILSSNTWTLEEVDAIKIELKEQLKEKLAYLSQTSGAEMVTRWDMQHSPPDIFITNFSMLNIILTRSIEQNMFKQTKEWLEEDPNNTFYLILDELHAYRGTSGTEVAYVIRTLLHRLGLTPNSPQLRVIATSASLEEEGKTFLEDFFGISYENFEIITGEREKQQLFKKSSLFKDKAEVFKNFYEIYSDEGEERATNFFEASFGIKAKAESTSGKLYEILNNSGVLHELINVFEKPVSFKEISKKLFKNDNFLAVGGLLLAITNARKNNQVALPLRGHFFFRNFLGLWACSNPTCDAVEENYKYEGRTIGKLYSQPRVQCDCGSRVLDFYYCQNCGDAFLGGYKVEDHTDLNSTSYILSAEFPDLESLPDKLPPAKRNRDYQIYWPGIHVEDEAKKWELSSKGEKVKFSWKKAHYNPRMGILVRDEEKPTGSMFVVESKNVNYDTDNIPALSTKCPHCADDWEGVKSLPLESHKRMKSPIRGQRTGFDMIMFVMLDSMMREFTQGETPKSVLFSDSRQDAAKLSAKLELNHYYNILRYIVVKVFREANQELRAYIKKLKNEQLDRREEELAENYRNSSKQNRQLARLLKDYFRGRLDEEEDEDEIREVKALLKKANNPPKLGELWHDIERSLIRLGINPGSPDSSIQRYLDNNKEYSWTKLIDWSKKDFPDRKINLNEDQWGHLARIGNKLRENVFINVLFSQRKRDLESVALARLTVDINKVFKNDLVEDFAFWRELVDSSIRILGGLKRYIGNEKKYPVEQPPKPLKQFWISIAKSANLNEEKLIENAKYIFESLKGVQGYLLDPNEVYIIPFTNETGVYMCNKCNRLHLHRSCGICTDCQSELSEIDSNSISTDYYRFLGEDDRTARRFHSEEMTGQTDEKDSLKRQLVFQGIFDEDDIPLVDEIDILSVTTTMEAGVDIGSLRLVAMSNMPPQRFNYQQRVGRCGRRGSSLSISLTMCRGRSHDDWYFDNLDKMTGDPPPQPYIDLKSTKIFKRVLIKEILFIAFQETDLLNIIDGGYSIHGEYGFTGDWDDIKIKISQFLSSPRGNKLTKEAIEVISYRTKLSDEDKRDCYKYISQGQLVQKISEIAEDPRYTDKNLSTNLAVAGLLPMFGFPTRLRSLHHKSRQQGYKARSLDYGKIDRDLEIAISEYSPGSEIVKDKLKHRVVGLAHYIRRGNRIVADSNPLGEIKNVALCRKCHFLYDSSTNQPEFCPSCNDKRDAHGSDYITLPLSEPKGFRSDWKRRDFNEQFEWSSSSSFPKLAQDRMGEENVFLNIKYNGQDGNVYSINDNFGSKFKFVKALNDFDGWIEESMIGTEGFNVPISGESKVIALASIKNTDVLILSPAKLNSSLELNPSKISVRAGLISFAYLFRRVATSILDVDGDEIQVGVRASKDQNRVIGQLFFADQLINGAGYAKHLAQDEMLGKIFKDITEELNYIPKLKDHDCDSSCYECLRTYENRGYHGILDLRLAFEVANILKDKDYMPEINDKWISLIQKSLNNIMKDYEADGVEVRWYNGVPSLILPERKKTFIFGHPFWNTKEDFLSENLCYAKLEAEEEIQDGNIYYYDFFDLLRRPMWVMKEIYEVLKEDTFIEL